MNACPRLMYGSSTGRPPIQVKRRQSTTNIQNRIWFSGKNANPRRSLGCVNGRENRIKIAENIAITPPSLFGMDRRMAYAQRKYHSG